MFQMKNCHPRQCWFLIALFGILGEEIIVFMKDIIRGKITPSKNQSLGPELEPEPQC